MISRKDIEIYDNKSDGFSKILDIENCTVGIINGYENITEKNQKKTERHFKTDEIFIPVCGEASLFIGDEEQKIELETGKIYSVKKGVWHSFVSEIGSVVIVVEKSGTGEENSEYRFKK